MSNEDKIINITIGIRFLKSFGVLDKTGQIIDDILYNSESPFNERSVFTNIEEVSTREKLLINKQGEYLRINESDLIFRILIDKNFKVKIKWIDEKVFPYFGNKLFKKYQIKNFTRLGIVIDHKVDAKDKEVIFNDFITSLSNKNIENAEGLSMAFNTKRLIAEESLIRKDVKDYRNTIYTINKEESKFKISLDYQYYYNPHPEDFRDCLTSAFLSSAENFLKNSFYKWL